MYLTSNKGRKDITGEYFGLLKVLCYTFTKHRKAYWLCECACGNFKVTSGTRLREGKTTSCGCKQYIHKMKGTRLYSIWQNMKSRCRAKSGRNFTFYTSKGIVVCNEWANDFVAFSKWAEDHGYEDSLTIDRIDGNLGYFPENCRWVTPKQQQNNMSSNRVITIDGVSHTMSEWSDISGVNAYNIYNRLKMKWDIKKAVFTPVNTLPATVA